MIRWLGLIFLLIGALSAWIFFSGKHPAKPKPTTATVNAYMNEAHYTQYDNTGQVHMIIYTPKMTHYAEDNTSYFANPHILAYSQQRIPWTIDAQFGKALRNSEEVDLWGGVLIHQAPQLRYPETSITTDSMKIYPHRSYAETDQFITITRPDTQVTATGMQADFKAGIFKLLSSVRGSYAPPQPVSH